MLEALILAVLAAPQPAVSTHPTPHAPAGPLQTETGMPQLPNYDPELHVSIPMRADVYQSLPEDARKAYDRVTYDAVVTNRAYKDCAKLNSSGIGSRILARKDEHEPVMGSVAVEIYAACY